MSAGEEAPKEARRAMTVVGRSCRLVALRTKSISAAYSFLAAQNFSVARTPSGVGAPGNPSRFAERFALVSAIASLS